MRILAMAALAMAIGAGAQADELAVYVAGWSFVPLGVLGRAEVLANQMFAGANVSIDWRKGEPFPVELQNQRPIVVEMLPKTPDKRLPGALAFARPYEGVHVDVFYDRVEAVTEGGSTPIVLAHVLVHEIAHVLQGINRHSKTGVMKACWSRQDYEQMDRAPLPFTEEDLALIQLGLAKRAGRVLSASYSH